MDVARLAVKTAKEFAQLKQMGVVDIELELDTPCVRMESVKALRNILPPETHLFIKKNPESHWIEFSCERDGVKFLWSGTYTPRKAGVLQ